MSDFRTEPWSEASVLDGLHRVQVALATINEESLRNGNAIQRAWPEFFGFMASVLEMEVALKAARAGAPCKQWGHDGAVWCSVHRCLRDEGSATGDCPVRVVDTP